MLIRPRTSVLLNIVLKNFSNIYNFGIDEVIRLYKKNKSIFDENIQTKRNEGQNMITGQKIWKRAKNIIPNGSMLFSKKELGLTELRRPMILKV